MRYAFDVNDCQDNTREVLLRFATQPDAPEATLFYYPQWKPLGLPDHQWNDERYRRMIQMRTGALARAASHGFDYLFSVDSDVILEDPETISHLLEAGVPIIAGVFKATWGNPIALALPNVWEQGQNEMSDQFLMTITDAQEHVKVGGLGACTLIRRDVWEAGVTYDPIYNLPSNYRGEDRNFCIRAVVHGFDLTACAHKRILHYEKPEPLHAERQNVIIADEWA